MVLFLFGSLVRESVATVYFKIRVREERNDRKELYVVNAEEREVREESGIGVRSEGRVDDSTSWQQQLLRTCCELRSSPFECWGVRQSVAGIPW
jgi:hypothetical protein